MKSVNLPTCMEIFNLHILGCGSALPTSRHFPTAQVLNVRNKLMMIDCGEGAQLQFRKCRLKFSRLNNVFLSHLHGDHCFGLPGLVSTLNLLGRTADLHIYSPVGLKAVMEPLLKTFNRSMNYQIIFHEFDTEEPSEIYADRSVTVTTIPLCHRIPCCGFLFAEVPGMRHIVRSAVDFYHVPLFELGRIKAGADYVTPDGRIIPNTLLTRPADPVRRYAYCSDTRFMPSLIEQIKGVDLLFHEATFIEADAARADETFHATARQAAEMARLAEVKLLLVGHYSARYDDESAILTEARNIFPQTMAARELQCVQIGRSVNVMSEC